MILAFCITVFSVQLGVAIFLQLMGRRIQRRLQSQNIEGVSVIIPFHNEEDRITGLIHSLNQLNLSEKVEFIFVDDYSTDNTQAVLTQKLTIPFKCIQNSTSKGKKRALRCGIEKALHNTVITWDADITVQPDYFEAIFELSQADLHILPVRMVGSNLWGKLASVEFYFLETFSRGFAGMGKALMCNGANLVFSKSTFWQVEEFREDYDIPSGDDLFLLKAVQNHGGIIHFETDRRLTVDTPAPKTIKELMQQRKRWFGKMGLLFNRGTLAALFLLILVNVAGVLSLIFSFVNPVFLFVFFLKYVAEVIAAFSFVKSKFSHVFLLLAHQVWYPFYALALLLPWQKEKRWRA